MLDCKQVHNCVAWYLVTVGDKNYSLGKIKAIHREQRQKVDSGKEEGDGRQAKGLTSWGQ